MPSKCVVVVIGSPDGQSITRVTVHGITQKVREGGIEPHAEAYRNATRFARHIVMNCYQDMRCTLMSDSITMPYDSGEHTVETEPLWIEQFDIRDLACDAARSACWPTEYSKWSEVLATRPLASVPVVKVNTEDYIPATVLHALKEARNDAGK